MKKQEQLTKLTHRLEFKNPDGPLEAGYTRIWQQDEWIKSLDAFDEDEKLTIEWGDGKISKS